MIKNNHVKLKRYLWTGIDIHGLKCHGELRTQNKQLANKLLAEQKIHVFSIRKKYNLENYFTEIHFSDKNRLQFFEKLLWLLSAGISITDAIKTIMNTTKDAQHNKIFEQIRERILAGSSFSTALSNHPNQFPNINQRLIEIGEKSGKLETILKQMIQHQTQHIALKKKITSATIYPACVLLITIIIMLGLLIFVIPQFQKIYASFNAPLPATTQFFITISQALSKHCWLILCSIILIILLCSQIITKNLSIQHLIQHQLLKTPILNTWLILKILTQWSQLFYTLLAADMPLIEALTLSNQAISHALFNQEITAVIDEICAGKTFADALNATTLIPTEAKQLIGIAENTDGLPQAIFKIAHLYDEQLNRNIEHLSKIIEPVIMILLASGIAGLIIAMYLPIFRMGSIM